MKHVIIGTAGHVDHGKTELVKALTGHDTDRLAEEKKRGISIVLGFAPIDLGNGMEAGVVDVPGHERFVKNMVSGAVGVDLALIVVAADEGVMPQTEEHFEVLRLLGVSSGVIAITKMDLVDEDIAGVVESEVEDLLAGTPLAGSPFVRTSVVTGSGIEEARAALARAAGEAAGRAPGFFFRMPVDRVFTRSGIGTIVTGTTWSGHVKSGDELMLEPQGRKVRVREVQSFEHDIDESVSGMRTAMALHGVKVEDVSIGNQLIEHGVLPVSFMIDVVAMPGSGRITGCRNGDALVEPLAAVIKGKLADQPAVGPLVVKDNGIPVVQGFTDPAKAAPDGIERQGAEKACTCLVEYLEMEVDGLDVMVRPDIAAGVGRGNAGNIMDAGKIDQGIGHHHLRGTGRGQNPVGRYG